MRVTMLNSVDDLVAGEEYDLDDEIADRFVLLGYAEGQLSRDYEVDERVEIETAHQVVSLGG